MIATLNDPAQAVISHDLQAVSRFTWAEALALPTATTEFFPGCFSAVFGAINPAEGLINRIMFCNEECTELPQQVHPDFGEVLLLMKGRLQETVTGRVIAEGQRIVIPPGRRHGFRRLEPGKIICDLLLQHTPLDGRGKPQLSGFSMA